MCIWPLVFLVFFLLILIGFLRRLSWVSDITKKYVLVTGCDTGFGNLLARRLDKLGCRVLAGCLTLDAAKTLKETCSERLKTVLLNVSDTDSVKAVYEEVKAIIPNNAGLWAVVNNAGIMGNSGPSEFHSKQDFQDCLDVNLLGLIDVTNTFMPLIKKACGRVINVSSGAGRIAYSQVPAYTVSKWGVVAFNECIRRSLAPFGVNSILIEPGGFGTPITDGSRAKKIWWNKWQDLAENIQEDYGTQYIEGCIKNMVDFMKNVDPNTDKVMNTYLHAIFSQNPRKRYSVGFKIRNFSIPISYMPCWIQDFYAEMYTPKPQCAVE